MSKAIDYMEKQIIEFDDKIEATTLEIQKLKALKKGCRNTLNRMYKRQTKGILYIINERETDNYKIGITKGSINRRLKQLQTGNSHILDVIKLYNIVKPSEVEGELHTRFRQFRTNGEWFKLNKEQIEEIDLCIVKKKV